MARLIEVNLIVVPTVLVVLACTILAASVIRRRNSAATVAAVFVVVGYVLDLIGRATQGTFFEQLRAVSYYSYYDSIGTMMNGIAWGNQLVLLVVAGIMLGLAVWAFERRDVGV